MSYPCFNQAVLINVVTAMSSCGMTRAWPLAWIQNWMKGQKVVNTKEGKKDSLAKCGFSNCGLTLAWAPGSRIEWIQCGAKTCELATQQTEERFTKVWFLKLWLDPVGNMKALLCLAAGRKLKNRPLFRKRNTSNIRLKTTKKQQTKNHQKKLPQKSNRLSGMKYILAVFNSSTNTNTNKETNVMGNEVVIHSNRNTRTNTH